jgi:heme a synthase
MQVTDTRAKERRRRAVRVWLMAMAALLVLMVMVGGTTRLTDSGLSIVEWRPVTGTLPPLNAADWNAEFAKYQTSSEYQLANSGMTLSEFKHIYWWEWGHRLLGRLIGVAFLVPLLFFEWRGFVEPGFRWRLWGIFGLGALQGAIGWWMVASGLVGRVDVAQERLAVHLTTACIILVAIVATAQALRPVRAAAPPPRRLAFTAASILGLLLLQIALGGLVAGLKAGLASDSWPLIDGAVIPPVDRLFTLAPLWVNFLDNPLTAQFTHRMVAYLLVALAAVHAIDCRYAGAWHCRRSALALVFVLLMQAGLGVATILWHVPIALALAHQAVAVLALIVATLHAGDVVAARASGSRSDPHAIAARAVRLSAR